MSEGIPGNNTVLGGVYDQHLHSIHSFDSSAVPADNVRAAMATGLAGLTFTEHYDVHPDDWKDCCYNESRIQSSIDELRSGVGTGIFVGKGIEVCFQPALMEDVVGFLRPHEFDLVILSIHYFSGKAVHRRQFWDGFATPEVVERYLQTVLEAVRWCESLHGRHGRVFDVLGHIDLVKRYAHRFRGSFSLEGFESIIDEILGGCLTARIVPEVNTSGIRQGTGEPMPGPSIMARYAELGGTAMSLGSDAHVSRDIGSDFPLAMEMLRSSGISHVALYEAGVRRDVQIPSGSAIS